MRPGWRRPLLAVAFLALGATSAPASSEGPLTYEYRTCSPVVDLLYDLSGDRNTDRRELTANLAGDPAWRTVIYKRLSFLLMTDKEKAVLRLGVIDKVLEVYLVTDKTREECAQAGCTASLTYDNGSRPFWHSHKIAIDANSIIHASIANYGSDATTPLDLNLFGAPKVVTVQGRREKFTIFQTGVFIPCPAPSAGAARCEGDLGELPQDETFAHANFQTVMTAREDLRGYEPASCEKFYEEYKLDAPR